ncbi:MAG: hypothetical protein WC386_02115 [Candidatus Paceibacterota bacterium]|jgi:hypothetical protein
MTFEELFKKANTEIKLERHKANLKSALLKNDYFNEEREVWDWKTFIPSLALSLVLVGFAFNFSTGTEEKVSNNDTFYSILSNNKNVSPATQASGANTLEMVDDNTKTVFYFNDRNVLVHSEVIKY